MSAAKMVADSTQSDSDNRKKKHKDAGRKDRKTKKDKRRRRRSISSNSSYSSRSGSRRSRSGGGGGSAVGSDGEYDSDVDLKKEVKPLSAYLRQPAQLLDQMLHSVRGTSLQRALPDALKTMPLEELRKRCLEHLEVMSRKRVKRILSGDDPAAISSSGTEDDDSSDDDKPIDAGSPAGDGVGFTLDNEKASQEVDTGCILDDVPGDSPLSLGGEDMEHELDDNTQQRHLQKEGETIQDDDIEEEEVDWGLEGGAEADVADVLFPEVEQDRMELLELEMRARAIKAMLAVHEHRDKGGNK